MSDKSYSLSSNPATLLQNLIRFDTTNPPGNEGPCIAYIHQLLQDAGVECTLVAQDPQRPNLVTRLKGEGNAAPLLLYGHVDVVGTHGQDWKYPPFEASLVDGTIWGRGALDDKHSIAMYLAALLKARENGLRLPGDVIFAATVDEETSSEAGARFLVEKHPDLFKDVRYALSEFGGASIPVAGRRFYPIMTSEKQACAVRVTFQGADGHGAVPVHNGAMAKMAQAVTRLNRKTLPVHITPQARLMVKAFAKGLGGISGLVMSQLLNPLFTDSLLKFLGESGRTFTTLLHNSVSPTMVEGSRTINIIPSKVTLELDGRVLPGLKASDLENELLNLLGKDCLIETNMPYPGPVSNDMGLFQTLADSLIDLDPAGYPVPFINFGVTDARFFSRLGIQTYGFTPLRISEGLTLTGTIHGANERVPVEALEFGTQAVLTVLQKFH